MTTHYIQTLGVAKCREIAGMTYKNAFISFDNGPLIAVNDIKKELALYDTDSCTDIRNHLSPNTVVIENNLHEQFQEANEAECGR